MADTQLNLKISDGGTLKPLIAGSETFKNNMHAGAAALSKGRMPGAATRAPRAASAPTGGGGGNGMGQELTTYGIQRGAVGTGAAGRDFGKQAQGLGGIVHLYATFAANLFAVGAAFRALSNAADTSNMVKGMDQLGARSGVALGSLAKRLAEVSDGAVSMRQAMEATTKASSSGMSTDAILRMGKVAKQASQALGIDMADALSRISRGVTKLEPELLDELGIFTKVGKATEDFAKSINKPVSALTEFERRMAFTNAVLDEGEKKFNAIKIDANPYAKLAASVADVAQNGLELLNKVLTPIFKILSESPTALIAAMAAIGVSLIKQAIPALGQFKAGLRSAADFAGKLSEQKKQDALEAQKRIGTLSLKELDARAAKEVDAIDAAERKIAELRKKGYKEGSHAAKLFSLDLDEITEKDLKKQEQIAKGLATKTTNLQKKGGSSADVAALKASAEAEAEVAKGFRGAIKAQDDFIKKGVELQEEHLKAAKGTSQYARTLEAADKASISATQAKMKATAAYNGELVGTFKAVRILRDDLAADESMTKWQKRATLAKGSVSALFGQVGSWIGKLGAIGQAVGILVGTFAMLDAFMSKASKELGIFNSALDRLEKSGDNFKRTMDAIFESEVFSVSSLEAKGKAFMEISEAFKAIGLAAQKAQAAVDKSWWDSLTNGIAGLFGRSIQKKFTKELGASLVNASMQLTGSSEGKAFTDNIAKILNIDNFDNEKDFEKAVKAVKAGTPAYAALEKELNRVGTAFSNTALKAKDFATSFDKSKESFKELTKTFEIKDPLVKWATEGLGSLSALSQALDSGDINDSMAAILKVTNELYKNPIFGIEQSSNLSKYGEEMQKVNKELNDSAIAVKALEVQKRELDKRYENSEASKYTAEQEKRARAALATQKSKTVKVGDNGDQNLETVNQRYERDSAAIKESIKEANAASAASAATLAKIRAEIKKSLNAGISYQITNIGAGLAAAMFKGSTQVLQSLYAGIDNVPELAQRQNELKLQELQSEETLIITMRNLAVASNTLQATIERDTAQRQVDSLKTSEARRANFAASDPRRLDLTPEQKNGAYGIDYAAKNTDLEQAERRLKFLNEAVSNPQKALAEYAEYLKTVTTDQKDLSERVSKAANEIAGFNKQLQGVGDKKFTLINVEGPLNILKAEVTQRKQLEKIEKDKLDLQSKQLSNDLETGRISKELGASKAHQIALDQNSNDLSDKLKANLDAQVASRVRSGALALKGDTDGALAVNAKADQLKLEEDSAAIGAKITADIQERIKYINKIFGIKKEELDYQILLSDKALELSNIEKDRLNNLKQITLETAAQTQKFTPEYLASLQDTASKDTTTSAAASTATTESKKFDDTKSKQEVEYQRLVQVGKYAEADKLNELMMRDAQVHGARLQQIEDEKNAKLKSIDEIAEYRKERENFNDLIASVKSLDGIYEGLGTTLAGIYTSIDDNKTKQIQYSNTIKDLEEKATKESDPEKKRALEAKINKEKQKGLKSELNGITAVASQGKKLFNEKSAAYKILNGIERASAMMSMAIEAQKLASSIAATIKGMTGKIPGIYASFMETMGPWGPAAAAAAIAAFMGGAFSGGGGGSSTPALTGDQQREAGDGQRWAVENGQNVLKDVGGGVFGDNAAKSESIINSLELMTSTSVEGLFYTNKMVKLLQGIRDGINGTASLLAGIPGLSGAGSAFGTREGTNSSGGFLGIGGLFSSTSSSAIIDAGLKFTKNFQAITEGVADAITYYETTRTTKTSSGFFGIGGSTSTRDSTITSAMGDKFPEAAAAIRDSFKGIGNTIVEFGSKMGISKQSIMSLLNDMDLSDITASLKGLNGQALQDEWGRVISKIFDRGTNLVFGSIVEKFRKIGEGAGETIARVIDGYTKVDLAFKSIGSTMPAIGVAGFEVSEAIIDLAGGLDVFLERTQFFRDNFMSDWQKETIMQASVTKGMAELGLSSITTKEQFSALYLSLDKTNPAARELRNSMDEIAPAFIEVSQAAEQLKNKTDDLLSQVYTLLGNDEAALAIKRERELAGTDDRLKSLQEYVYALEDLNKIESELKKSYKEQTSTLESFLNSADGWISSLLKLKDSLALGGQSTLTPGAKYSEARSQFSTALMGANKAIDFTASKEEQDRQIKEKSDAISAVQSLSSVFLDSSKIYNASSSQYTADYSYIQAALSSTASTLEAQKFTAKTALDYAKAQEALLGGVREDTRTIAQLEAERNVALAKAEEKRQIWESFSLAYTEGQATMTALIVASVDNNALTVYNAIVDNAIAVTTALIGTANTGNLAEVLLQTSGGDSGYGSDPSDGGTVSQSALESIGLGLMSYGEIGIAPGAVVASILGAMAVDQAIDNISAQYSAIASATANQTAMDSASAADAGVSGANNEDSHDSDGNNSGSDNDSNEGSGGFAKGGYASMGRHLVGELGPELIDFSTPGRVYTAQETFGMFNGTNNSNIQLLNELKALRQEVAALRQQQTTETGHLINATYEAQSQNADAVSQAVLENGKKQIWDAKVKQTVKLA